jgi:hypothetical protein
MQLAADNFIDWVCTIRTLFIGSDSCCNSDSAISFVHQLPQVIHSLLIYIIRSLPGAVRLLE